MTLISFNFFSSGQQFTIDQTLSDGAQRTTIAFDGMAFVTGNLGADSFFPPGKVADFWGFQYLRDNDPTHMGHNTDFLTKASLNMLQVLTPQQRQELITLATSQVDMINEYGYDRFVLMKAFRRLLEGDLPTGTNSLDQEAVKAFSAELYQLDGTISYMRAKVMGNIIHVLTPGQKAYLDQMAGVGMLNWPNVPEPPELQGLSHDVKVAVMTYAGDMFSWYVGSVAADVYFCPERQGTYFGSFYMKDAPAVGNPNYTIDTNLTADYGNAFLNVINMGDSLAIAGIVDVQKPALYEIVDKREEIAIELRKFMTGETADSNLVLSLMGAYGELDGEIVYLYASTFASVSEGLTGAQTDTLMARRLELLGDLSIPTGAYLYAEQIPMPEIPNTDFLFSNNTSTTITYPVVGTDVTDCYNNTVTITCPVDPGVAFYGQFPGENLPTYQNNGNGTITDLVTGLTWQRSPDSNGDNDGIIERTDKKSWAQIQARVTVLNSTNWGGYSDWRIPTIKELFSLTNWNGTDPSGYLSNNTAPLTPFIDNTVFHYAWGQTNGGERLIDSQYASCNLYNELSFSGCNMLFGFNFADGRIKGYDLIFNGAQKTFSFIAVRGNAGYSLNLLDDNADETITDNATGLMWTKNNSETPMNWEQALAWAQTKNAQNYCGHNDWRLPNAKELQTIVDYSRSPSSTGSAAINPVFNCTSIINEAGRTDWPWFWTSTTHKSYDGTAYRGDWAVYICFGRAAGWVKTGNNPYYSYRDVHGAGAQRSSPKSGTFLGQYMGVDSLGHPVYGLGPQGDILRINNYVRLVRDAGTTPPPRTQILDMPQGWSGISLGIVPDNPLVSDLFSALITNEQLIILQNFSSYYWPAAGVNTIDLSGGWDVNSGYQIKLSEAQQITVTGTSNSDKTITIPDAGWYLIPVLNECGAGVNDLFGNIQDQLVVIKEVAGTQILWPGVVQTLFTLEAGKSYCAKFSGPVSFTFPDCLQNNLSMSKIVQVPATTHFLPVPATPGSHLVVIPTEILSGLTEGSEAAAFTSDGICVGAAQIDSKTKNILLSTYPDDPTTLVKDGFTPDEPIVLKVFCPDTQLEYGLENIIYDETLSENPGAYCRNGLTVVKYLEMTQVNEYDDGFMIFPNPTTGIVNVSNSNEGNLSISFSDMFGRQLPGTYSLAASQTSSFDLSGEQPGIYLMFLQSPHEKTVRKIILNQ